MCEATVYMDRQGDEELILEAVDLIEPEGDGFRLVSIFGEQKVVKGKIKNMSLVNHKVILEPA